LADVDGLSVRGDLELDRTQPFLSQCDLSQLFPRSSGVDPDGRRADEHRHPDLVCAWWEEQRLGTTLALTPRKSAVGPVRDGELELEEAIQEVAVGFGAAVRRRLRWGGSLDTLLGPCTSNTQQGREEDDDGPV
jgi:hypothetical protein